MFKIDVWGISNKTQRAGGSVNHVRSPLMVISPDLTTSYFHPSMLKHCFWVSLVLLSTAVAVLHYKSS